MTDAERLRVVAGAVLAGPPTVPEYDKECARAALAWADAIERDAAPDDARIRADEIAALRAERDALRQLAVTVVRAEWAEAYVDSLRSVVAECHRQRNIALERAERAEAAINAKDTTIAALRAALAEAWIGGAL